MGDSARTLASRVIAWRKRNGSRTIAIGAAIGGPGCEGVVLAHPLETAVPDLSQQSNTAPSQARGAADVRSAAQCGVAPASRKPPEAAPLEDEEAFERESIELHRSGEAICDWTFPSASERDFDDSRRWTSALKELAILLAPRDERLKAFYVPTLFQSLAGSGETELRKRITPIFSTDMARAYLRAIAFRQELSKHAGRVALIIDLPGPDAVAFAAALADHFTPVFSFDNIPHPCAVVPAHQTLAAALYYLPVFERAATSRSEQAPPMFIFDANRRLPYEDEDDLFDNRYSAKAPDSMGLMRLGINWLMLITEDDAKWAAVDSDDERGLIDPEESSLQQPGYGPTRSVSLGTLWWTLGSPPSGGGGSVFAFRGVASGG